MCVPGMLTELLVTVRTVVIPGQPAALLQYLFLQEVLSDYHSPGSRSSEWHQDNTNHNIHNYVKAHTCQSLTLCQELLSMLSHLTRALTPM